MPDLASKIDAQLGQIYKDNIPWKQQLEWGILKSNSFLPEPNPIINKLEYEYLVCEIYNLKEDWEKLLVRSLNILQSYNLLESDYLPIYYLKGEALWNMGRLKEAKQVFLEIQGMNPSFRIVTQRLEDIGKNK